jgi:hypothetical protein
MLSLVGVRVKGAELLATMASPALMFSYLFLVLIVVVVIVLLCLGCSCHVPLGKCVRCFCENTTECCTRCCPRKKKDEKFKSVLDEPKRGPDAKKSVKQVNDETSQAGCLHWFPYVLTCGFCCGAFKEEEDERDASKGAAAVAQPVSRKGEALEDVDDVVGTDYVIAVSMPLLSMPSS